MSKTPRNALDRITEVAVQRSAGLKAVAYHALASRGAYPSKEDVEDVLSQAYLDAASRCLQDPPRLRHPEAWFKRVVFLRCLHFLRERSKNPLDLAVLDALAEDSALMLEVETWGLDRKILAAQLTELAEPEDRDILGRFATGWTSGDIGEALGLSATAVRKRLSRILQSLRRRADELLAPSP